MSRDRNGKAVKRANKLAPFQFPLILILQLGLPEAARPACDQFLHSRVQSRHTFVARRDKAKNLFLIYFKQPPNIQ